jgi:cell division protein FtsB
MQINYSQEALDNLRALPRRFADQIIRKIARLEHGLAGVSGFKSATLAIACAPGIIESCLISLATASSFRGSRNAAKLMISTDKKPTFAAQKRRVVKEISRLREEVEDLMDYLDLLEARAKNKGKRTYTTDEVQTELELPSR